MTPKGPIRPDPMTPPQAAELLSYAALFDARTIGKTDAFAWAHALSDLDPVDCREAITEYYRRNSTRITVSKIREHVYLAKRTRDEEARNRALFEPYHPTDNPHGLPPLDLELNRAGRALVLAAAAEHKEWQAAKTLGQRRITPIRDALDRSLAQPGRWTVFELVRELGIDVSATTGDDAADVLTQLMLPIEEEDPKWLKARDRAQAEKAARTGRTPV